MVLHRPRRFVTNIPSQPSAANPCVKYVILLMAFLGTVDVTASGEICGFVKNEASCDIIVASTHPAHMRATINQCNNPVDVTFNIKMVNATWRWSHTFANRDEIQRLPGLTEDAYLQVALKTHPSSGRLHVFASLDVSSRPVQVVLDDMVPLLPADGPEGPGGGGLPNCGKHTNPNAYLPLVIFIILLILIATLLATIVGFRRHRFYRRHNELLSNMEPVSTTYRDDPATISSTIIKNGIYRDTVTSIAENDTGHSGASSGSSGGSAGLMPDVRIRPPPPSGGRRKRMLKNGLPQPVLERLPEEPGEEDSSSRETDAGVNPSVDIMT